MGRWLRGFGWVGVVASFAAGLGCDAIEAAGLSIEPPTAALNRVDLITAPSVDELLAYGCVNTLGSTTCAVAGLDDAPPKKDLLFSFDVVFDVENPNADLPIPLVEVLLGFTAFDTTDLGAVCVRLCDPADAACTPAADAEGACDAGDAQNVDEPEDLIPTVDDLVALAEALQNGTVDNGAWRVLEPGAATEAHFQFDLGIDPMLSLGDNLLGDALDDLLAGRPVALVVPYTVEGSLFFDVPELGRYALGFGPFADNWPLQ